MNSDPNSDLKQCIESKLGWVHSVQTQGPRPRTRCRRNEPRPCARRRVVALSDRVANRVLSCRRARRVAGPPPPPSVATQNLCHNTTHVARAPRAVLCVHNVMSMRAAAMSQRCILALLHRIATSKVSPSHDTNHCIVTHP